ncbi:MAG: hypothetical protein GXO26_08145 [Crenarchaeota archaeon]|nr:hypothetical protein [Thermoproteota archaeon]
MALSNWAIALWRIEKGEYVPTITRRLRFDDIVIEFYKDWINIYINGVKTCEVHDGVVYLDNVEIYARKVRHNALFFIIDAVTEKYCGILAYAYDGDRYVGISEELVKEFIQWLREIEKCMEEGNCVHTYPIIEAPEKLEVKWFNQGTYYLLVELWKKISTEEVEEKYEMFRECILEKLIG